MSLSIPWLKSHDFRLGIIKSNQSTTIFSFANSNNPILLISLPNPEFLMPPNGNSGCALEGWLMKIFPVSIASSTFLARSASFEQTAPARQCSEYWRFRASDDKAWLFCRFRIYKSSAASTRCPLFRNIAKYRYKVRLLRDLHAKAWRNRLPKHRQFPWKKTRWRRLVRWLIFFIKNSVRIFVFSDITFD